MRVGLVLGAGGVVGASWLIGALEALEAETGWKGVEAERIVGTSAGSVIGALTAAGVEPELMGAYASGASLDEYAEAEARVGDLEERYTGSEYRLTRALPPLGPGSWRLIAGTLRHPRQHNPAAMLAGWLPRGFVSTDPIQRLVESYIDDAWPAHPELLGRGRRLRHGKRTAFGSEGAPPARASARPSPRRARSPASTTRPRSAAGATSTAASARTRTSTCSPARGWTSSSA